MSRYKPRETLREVARKMLRKEPPVSRYKPREALREVARKMLRKGAWEMSEAPVSRYRPRETLREVARKMLRKEPPVSRYLAQGAQQNPLRVLWLLIDQGADYPCAWKNSPAWRSAGLRPPGLAPARSPVKSAVRSAVKSAAGRPARRHPLQDYCPPAVPNPAAVQPQQLPVEVVCASSPAPAPARSAVESAVKSAAGRPTRRHPLQDYCPPAVPNPAAVQPQQLPVEVVCASSPAPAFLPALAPVFLPALILDFLPSLILAFVPVPAKAAPVPLRYPDIGMCMECAAAAVRLSGLSSLFSRPGLPGPAGVPYSCTPVLPAFSFHVRLPFVSSTILPLAPAPTAPPSRTRHS